MSSTFVHDFGVQNFFPDFLVSISDRQQEGLYEVLRRLNTQDSKNPALRLNPKRLLLRMRIFKGVL